MPAEAASAEVSRRKRQVSCQHCSHSPAGLFWQRKYSMWFYRTGC